MALEVCRQPRAGITRHHAQHVLKTFGNRFALELYRQPLIGPLDDPEDRLQQLRASITMPGSRNPAIFVDQLLALVEMTSNEVGKFFADRHRGNFFLGFKQTVLKRAGHHHRPRALCQRFGSGLHMRGGLRNGAHGLAILSCRGIGRKIQPQRRIGIVNEIDRSCKTPDVGASPTDSDDVPVCIDDSRAGVAGNAKGISARTLNHKRIAVEA